MTTAASSGFDVNARAGAIPVLLLLSCLTGLTSAASAQDALRGKRLYHDVGRLTGAGSSCIDCHGGVPGALHGIGKAAANPEAIFYALGAVQQMAHLRGRLDAQDMADIAAYLHHPAVSGPELRLSTLGQAASPGNPGRLDFSSAPGGTASLIGTVRIANAGEKALQLRSGPFLDGADAVSFDIVTTDCYAGMRLVAGQGCSITVGYRPRGVGVRRIARVGLLHDWINGGVFVALTGRNR